MTQFKQFLQKIVENSGFNWQFGRMIYCNNVSYAAPGDEVDFDSDKSYNNKSVLIITFGDILNGHSIPYHHDGHTHLKLNLMTITTSYQDLTGPGSYFNVKANNTDGLRIRVDPGSAPATYYLRALIIQIDLDAGIPIV